MRRKADRFCRAVSCAWVFAALLGGCAEAMPEVRDRDFPKATYFTVVVRPGDTLSGIGGRYDVSVSSIVAMNRLGSETHVRAGETLRIPASGSATREAVLEEASDGRVPSYAPPPKPIDTTRFEPASVSVRKLAATKQPVPRMQRVADTDVALAIEPVAVASHPSHSPARFAWPLEGEVISPFGNMGKGEKNDGINIAADTGTPIHAAASGRVTYAGHELKGYGNLVLIEHNDGYVTAYAHAESISVGRGDRVEKGQVIGLAGATGDVDRPQLHFEIRKGMQPVNPRLLLASN